SFADLNEIEEPPASESTGAVVDPALVDQFTGAPAEAAGGVGEDGKPASVETMMQQELESVDFYITQGYSDIAVDSLNLLERQFGSNPEIDARRAKLQASALSSEASAFEVMSEPAASDMEVVEQNVVLDAAFGDVEIVPERSAPPTA